PGAVREPLALRGQSMFFFRAHFTECPVEAVRTEKRIVTETFVATRRPDGDAVDLAFEFLNMAIGPRETQCGNKMRTTLLGSFGTSLDEHGLNAVHRGPEILIWSGPPRGMNAGIAIERVDHQAGIVGKGHRATGARRGDSFDACVGGERLAGLFWLGQTEFGRRLRGDAVRREQLAHFLQLAGVVGGDHHRPCEFFAHMTAIFCRLTSFSIPLRARPSNAANWSSLKGIFSAVAWISTMLPEPVMTKLASVSASESSA